MPEKDNKIRETEAKSTLKVGVDNVRTTLITRFAVVAFAMGMHSSLAHAFTGFLRELEKASVRFAFGVLLLAACDSHFGEYQSVHRDIGQGSVSDRCLGIKKEANIVGYTPNPYAKLHRLEMRAELDGEVESFSVRIVRSWADRESATMYLRGIANECDSTGDLHDLNVYSLERHYQRGCEASRSTVYLPKDAAATLSQILCADDMVRNCQLIVIRNQWEFSLSLPVDDIALWKRIREALVMYIDSSFDDLGVCS